MARVVAALLAGLVLGGFDDAIAGWSAWAAHSLANSAGAWTLASFLVAWSARTNRGAAARGLACMVGLVAGFYLVAPLHTPQPSSGMLPFWLVLAGIVGPLVGLAAGTARRGRRRPATTAALAVGTVIALDAAIQGTSPTISTQGRPASAVYWCIQAAIGLGLPIVPVRFRRHAPSHLDSPTATLDERRLTGPSPTARRGILRRASHHTQTHHGDDPGS